MHSDYQLPVPRSGSSKWVILFTSDGGRANEWETAEGTLEQAIAQATCNWRHLNYGRTGYRIVPDVLPHGPDQRPRWRKTHSLHRDGSAATWKHERGGKGNSAWQKWVSNELKAWVTWWKCNPSVVHYGSNATYRGTMAATPDQAMNEIEMRQNAAMSDGAKNL